MKKLLPMFTAAVLISHLPVRATAATYSYQGFGANTAAGTGKKLVRITNLEDSGAGSLRDALSQGNRTIVFDVAGEIRLSSAIKVRGAFITIDGYSAPSPGITLRGAGLSFHGTRGAHDIIVRGLRIRDSRATASTDGITIAYGAYNVIVDHVSISGSIDENIDITEGSHDVTVSWSIIGGNGKNMLIKYNPSRVTLHHNLFIQSNTRNPQMRIDDVGTLATDTTVDMRNNIIWQWGNGYGTLVWYGPKANVINNYYSSSNGAIRVSSARAHVSGNLSADKKELNRVGNEASPFAAPPVDTQDACMAVNLVLANAGFRPLDSQDQQYTSAVTIAPCSGRASGGTGPNRFAFKGRSGEIFPLKGWPYQASLPMGSWSTSR